MKSIVIKVDYAIRANFQRTQILLIKSGSSLKIQKDKPIISGDHNDH